MPFITSTVEKVLAIAVAALLMLCIAFGGLWWYRGTVIDKQDLEIAQQKKQLELYAKDKAAQDKADKQLKAAKDKIAKERDQAQKDLKDALDGNKCTDEPIPDDAKRLLNKLYSGQGS